MKKIHIFPLTCSAIFQSRLFWRAFLSFGRRDFCLLSDVMGVHVRTAEMRRGRLSPLVVVGSSEEVIEQLVQTETVDIRVAMIKSISKANNLIISQSF